MKKKDLKNGQNMQPLKDEALFLKLCGPVSSL